MNGLGRKAVVNDNLRGAAQVQPVMLQSASGAGGAAAVRPSAPSFDLEIGNQVAKFAQGKLSEAVALKQEKSYLDGQMAAQQGKAFEEVEMAGDKWALEGFRVVQAQQLASGLLTAQQHEIATGAYQMSPDEYRAHFMGRAEALLDASGDRRTAELAREQLLRQMPVLVQTHTTANLEWAEQQNFQSLETAIDTISRDPTAVDQLVSFARGGEGTATSGLADDRRRAAVVSGVIRAFDNDNPVAFAVLSNEGLLGDDLTTDQLNSIRAAQQRFEGRRRQEYDQELFTAETALMEDVRNGAMEPMAAVEALSTLYAEHGITMNANEAGAVYADAVTGNRVEAITRGALIDTAGAMGDTDRQADLIIQSLTATESSGNSAAYRTNVDGRSFGGLLQFGDARLADYARATGTPPITANQFRNLTEGEQEAVNRWHIKDLMQQAQATGAIGSTINGVTVTLSGLVAVAHLGGAAGMRRFVESNGEYNPSDELGTSLTDYLRKHAAGEADHLFTPEQRMQRAIQTRNAVYERTAAEADALMRPERDRDDALFRNGILTREEWSARNQARHETYGVQRTLATVEHEANILSEVAVAGVEAAVSEDDRQRNLSYQLEVEAAREDFNATAEAVSNGQLPPTVLEAAASNFFARTAQASVDTGVAVQPNEVLADVRRISQLDTEARAANVQFHEDGVLIDQAIASGTLGELPKELRDRAIRENEQRLVSLSEDSVASGNLSIEQQPGWVTQEHRTFLAQSGVVDERMRRVMNGYLAGGPVDRQGEPRPEYVEAVQAYRDLAAVNPSLADQYISPEYRSDMDAILHNAGDGPLEGAIRTWGIRAADTPEERDPDVFINTPRIQRDIDNTVTAFLQEQDIGFWHSIWQSDADMSQMFDMTNTDRADVWSEDNKAVVTAELRYELEQAYSLSPRAKPSELVDAAARRVQERTTIIGGEPVVTPRGQPSLGERFFGARAPEFTDQDGVYNTAVMQWLRSEDVREQYPYLNETTFAESLPTWLPDIIRGEDTGTPTDQMNTWITGVRPFSTRVHPNTGDLYIEVSRPEGGYYDTIVLPTREIGNLYMQQHREDVTGVAAPRFTQEEIRAMEDAAFQDRLDQASE